MLHENRRACGRPVLFRASLAVALSVWMGEPVARAGDVTVVGATGVNGSNGLAGNPGQPGGAGGNGENTGATASSSDRSNNAVALAGDGGRGGEGGAGVPTNGQGGANAGNGGAGGNGGDANASATTNAFSATVVTRATSVASAGDGGAGGLEGFPLSFGLFGTPGANGNGGNAQADATLLNTTGSGHVKADAIGGNGSEAVNYPTNAGYGGNARAVVTGRSKYNLIGEVLAAGGQAGFVPHTIGNGAKGGDAFASASLKGGKNVDVSAGAIGGNGSDGGPESFFEAGGDGGAATLGKVEGISTVGGNVNVTGRAAGGSGGADRGRGFSVHLLDAVDGSTTGQLTLRQSAAGGNAGTNDGIAGNASSSLTRIKLARSLSVVTSAQGGAGAYNPSTFATGGLGGAAVSNAGATNGAGRAYARAEANGGPAGGATDGGGGGTGGRADATANATSTAPGEFAGAYGIAVGSFGGSANSGYSGGGSGGTGGQASSMSDARSTRGGPVVARDTATGGTGGGAFDSVGVAVLGGAGGAASTTTSVRRTGGTAPAQAFSTARAGAGGNGASGGTGASGGDARALGNGEVTGEGTLTVSVDGVAGAGGSTFDDTGNGFFAGGGRGGNAHVEGKGYTTGNGTVNVRASATGGRSGLGVIPELNGGGGAATALVTAYGSGQTLADARAVAGQARAIEFRDPARATARADGASGSARASAVSGGGALGTIRTTAFAPVAGAAVSLVEARSAVAQALPAFTDAAGQQSSAFFTGSPFKSDVSTQLNGSPRDADGNPKVTSSLGTSSQVFGVGLLGSHTNVGTLAIPKLYSSTIDLSVRLPQITSPANLKVGLLDPVGIGSGFESLHFQVFKEGTPVVDQFFTGTTRLDDALAYFDDHTLDLGRIDQGVSGLLDVQFRFDLILTSPGTGFDTTFLLANGPTTPTLTRAFAPLSLFASVSVLRSSSVSVVPEPASAGVIVLLGSVALLERRRRRPSV